MVAIMCRHMIVLLVVRITQGKIENDHLHSRYLLQFHAHKACTHNRVAA